MCGISPRFCITLLSLLVGAAPLVAAASELYSGSFELSRFGSSAPPRAVELRAGLQALFRSSGGLAPQTEKQITRQSIAFYQQIAGKVAAERSSGKPIPFNASRDTFGPVESFEREDVTFPSLVQRPGNHPSNQVRGIWLHPSRPNCPNARFPTIFLIHSSVDNLEQVELRIAESLVTISQQLNVFLIYLPHYGPRRLGRARHPEQTNVEFIAPDASLGQLKQNLAQALLDIHESLDWLRSRPLIDFNRFTFLGVSMGGLIEPLYLGMNPGIATGGMIDMVGGADLASILTRFIQSRSGEEAAVALERLGWNEEQARLKLAPLDPLLWASRIRDTRFLYIGARRDELMDRQKSVEPLLGSLGSGTRAESSWLDTAHSPADAGELYLLFNLLAPIQQFSMGESGAPAIDCR